MPLWCLMDGPSLLQWELSRVLLLAASAESGSEHPLGRALVAFAALHLNPQLPAFQDSPTSSYDSGGSVGHTKISLEV